MKKIIVALISTLTILTMTACAVPGAGSKGSIIKPDADGYAEGRVDDIMRSYFFDFTVKSAYLCDVYGSYLPMDGYELLVVDMTIKNTFSKSLPMFDDDFMITWGDGDKDYDVPVTYYAGDSFGDEVFPSEYALKINESRDGLMIFEVPENCQDFSIFYLEIFDDDSTGDVFFVYFTADHQ